MTNQKTKMDVQMSQICLCVWPNERLKGKTAASRPIDMLLLESRQRVEHILVVFVAVVDDFDFVLLRSQHPSAQHWLETFSGRKETPSSLLFLVHLIWLFNVREAQKFGLFLEWFELHGSIGRTAFTVEIGIGFARHHAITSGGQYIVANQFVNLSRLLHCEYLSQHNSTITLYSSSCVWSEALPFMQNEKLTLATSSR